METKKIRRREYAERDVEFNYVASVTQDLMSDFSKVCKECESYKPDKKGRKILVVGFCKKRKTVVSDHWGC